MPRPELPALRSLAWVYCSVTQRLALTTLSAIEREIGASTRPGLEHPVAHARLAWWREECERTARGRPGHPLTRELLALFAPLGAAPLASLPGLVDTAAWDLAGATFETGRELVGYCERWSAALIAPLVRLAAPDSPLAQAHDLGVKLRQIEMLLSLARDARAGRLRLPLDELERAGVSPESLARPPWPPALTELLRARHRELRAALGVTVEALPPFVRQRLRGVIVWAALACIASARAEKRLPHASRPRDQQAPLDGWRAWRAARQVDSPREPGRARAS